VTGLLFRALARLLSLLPLRLLHGLARPLAWVLWRLSSRLRNVSLANLALCYPALSPAEREEGAKQAMFHYACNALEVGVCWYGSRRRFDRLFEPPAGREAVDAALASERGVLFMGPHFGAWELAGLAVSDMTAVTLYKPGRDASINRLLVERRERFGARLVPANRRGLKALMDALRNGGGAAVLPDQEPTEGEGRFAPFFGVPALTGVLVPRLVRRTGVEAFFVGCVRLPGGRFRVHYIPAEPALYDDDMDSALAALNRGVEAVIALDPEQYLWGYKRFRARPAGEERFY
jgi:KDO2-lipid IV(A) lauroyltransferase